MKKLLIASVIAVASAVASIASASAATIEFGIGNGYNDDYYDGPYSNYYRPRHADRYYGDYGMYGDGDGYRPYHRHYRQRCWMEQEVHWRHHHRVFEDVRVCRR